MKKYQMFVDGREAESSTGDWFETFDPFLGAPWALIPRGAAADVDRAVQAAHAQFAGVNGRN